MIYFHKVHVGSYFGICPLKGTVRITRIKNSWLVIVKRNEIFKPVFESYFDTLRRAKSFCYTYELDLFGRD